MDGLMLLLLPLILGWILDHVFGDPEALPHPVVYMGRWISFWEHRLNKGCCRKFKGALLAIGSILLIFLLFRTMINALCFIENYGGKHFSFICLVLFQSIAVFYCLAGCTLRKEVRMVFEALDRSLEEGRSQVARIVGRDTQNLSEQEVKAAALETLAENLSDGVVAPLFWLMLLGVPGMMMYKMVNTLDSMIGYHTPRYLDFGCWAARIDDVANYIPARLTAILILIVGVRYSKSLTFGQCCAFVCKYGPKHASPNSGWPEAALASILDCQFGGPHNYFGEYFYKPYIGENARLLDNTDKTISLKIANQSETLCVSFLFVILCVVFSL